MSVKGKSHQDKDNPFLSVVLKNFHRSSIFVSVQLSTCNLSTPRFGSAFTAKFQRWRCLCLWCPKPLRKRIWHLARPKPEAKTSQTSRRKVWLQKHLLPTCNRALGKFAGIIGIDCAAYLRRPSNEFLDFDFFLNMAMMEDAKCCSNGSSLRSFYLSLPDFCQCWKSMVRSTSLYLRGWCQHDGQRTKCEEL